MSVQVDSQPSEANKACVQAPGLEPRRLPWPLAWPSVPLLWIAPRRMGPLLSTVRWPGVLTAWLFWMLYGVGWVAMVDGPLVWNDPPRHDPGAGQSERQQFLGLGTRAQRPGPQ